jgi:hypothetical protein
MAAKSRNADISVSKIAAVSTNGRFSRCIAADVLEGYRCCSRERFRRITSGKGSVQSFRALQSNDRFNQPNVRESGQPAESVAFSVFRE